MDAERGEQFLHGDGVEALDRWQLNAPFSCFQDTLQHSAVDPNCPNESESEDVLPAVDPNEVLPSTPLVSLSCQLVYDISSLGAVMTEPGQENVISIELDEWRSQVLFSDNCVLNQLPGISAVPPEYPSSPGGDLLIPDLHLTEEEQQVLTQEGVSLPNSLPLSKAEERILKRVRRKIRNKQSAQDSRRRRKEYIDGLESRAVAYSSENKELQRTVEQLEKRNMSLSAQLGRLQSLIQQTVSRGAQTTTCLLLILVSLGLIIMPSFSPFSRNSSPDDDYRPTRVISRNILTNPSISQPTAEDSDVSTVLSDSSSTPIKVTQSGPLESAAILQEPIENPDYTGFDRMTPEGSQSGNSSDPVSGQPEPLVLGLTSSAGKVGGDAPKPAHADEM
ncbi:cyclic AMP-responsive element-binding protein 3-like protein 4 [Pungitius pungitius]|uniref:cyclic AMP-responsive element-binding protein 3-like protein 4 n=1 Tax=Pungitius pungitius TaxID=134920 RepID=UPI002E156C06